MATNYVRSIASPIDTTANMIDAEAQLYEDFAALGIVYQRYEHAAVFTVAESNLHNDQIPGAHTKNLFLKDKAGQFFLVTVPAEARVDLKLLPSAIGSGRLSFGKAEDMVRLLGITPGAVTALSAVNDSGGDVRFVIDSALMQAELVICHPLRNTATLGLSPDNLVRALTFWQHAPLVTNIPVIKMESA